MVKLELTNCGSLLRLPLLPYGLKHLGVERNRKLTEVSGRCLQLHGTAGVSSKSLES
jgi:hypothetical protein